MVSVEQTTECLCLLGEVGAELDVGAPLLRVTNALSDHDKEQVLRFAEFLADAGRP
ncbi:hypothetical protein [Candidatus Poriferisodalis sp.]|uniref:hypothetical protein n=1 Tax=Candidatus Poriferisodalis sp. TaxID=3101277 RepID=UPI003D147B96